MGRAARQLSTDSQRRLPSLRGTPFGPSTNGAAMRLLTSRQRESLATIATRLQLPRRTILYEERDPANSVYILEQGLVKAFRALHDEKQRVTAFLGPEDLFGLSENGVYCNSAQAITPIAVHRVPFEELTTMLQRDPVMEFQFLCKVTHELRESQRQTLILSRRDSTGRLAMFLRSLEQELWHGRITSLISLPMSRSDIADFVGLSLPAVSRAFTDLRRREIVTLETPTRVRVLDRRRFNALAEAA
jgi:CRP-like cAMP-binding protein